MRITLVSPYSDITSLGIRILSAILKREGHEVHLIFLPHLPSETVDDSSDRDYSLTQLDALVAIAQGSGLIGISLMTNYFSRAVTITKHLKTSLGIPVVWGGIHPTIRPSECLDYADYVCVGEGEEAVVELVDALADGTVTTQIPNILYRRDGKLITTDVRPLIQNLDSIPFPDYDLKNHWVWDQAENRMLPMDDSVFHTFLNLGHISRIKNQTAYQTIATRGCPHNCSYCCNNVLRELYHGQNYLRRRSLTNLLAELEAVTTRFPFIKVIGFSDDSFFADSEEGIQQFADEYKNRINLPFFCLGSPLTITRPKMKSLVIAGLFGLQMGIQSGSPATQRVYNRSVDNTKVLAAAKILNEFKAAMIPPTYDFIIDNPLENQDDLLATIGLILKLPHPRRIQLFSLVVFPETGIYHRLLEESKLQPFGPEAYDREYHQHGGSYLNLVLSLIRNNVPSPVIQVLIHPVMLKILNRPGLIGIYEALYRNIRTFLRRLRGQRRT